MVIDAVVGCYCVVVVVVNDGDAGGVVIDDGAGCGCVDVVSTVIMADGVNCSGAG